MSKITEAQSILAALHLPMAQRGEIAALTLLVLAQLDERTPWTAAKRQSLRIHDVMQEMSSRFGRTYAENTRETVRRQVIHQFEQARIVDRNPDEPNLPTNSPRTHYALTDAALETIRQFNTTAVAHFLSTQASLSEQYIRQRRLQLIPLTYQGQEYHLSPGKHNALQVAIVESFGPRYAPGAQLLYLGDTANKSLLMDEVALRGLNLTLASHDKLPDVILFDADRKWLFLIEAVTSHGPVTPKRRLELDTLFADCPAGLIYVSAFPDLGTLRSFLTEIAWETEVWISERPDHLIHFNGDRFIGPRTE
ncbi:MAG: BsuBI/PstI family type II restriction endonuclease [Anaerolineae bacterium]